MKKLKMLGCVGLLLALTACQAGTGNSADSNKVAEQKLQLVLKRLFRQWNHTQRGYDLDFSHESSL